MEEPNNIYCDMRTGEPACIPHPENKETTGVVPQFQLEENPTAVSQNRRHQNTKQIVLLIIAVVFFAILSAMFIGLYFTAENKDKSCGSKDSPVNKKSNESEENSTVVSTSVKHNPANKGKKTCSTVVSTPMNRTNNDTKVLERYSLKFKGNNTNDYAQTTGAPAMTAVTVSFWLKTTQSSDGHLVSYAVSERDNELVILFTANSIKVPLRTSEKSSSGFSFIRFMNIKINDGIWHHLYFAWESITESYSLRKDGVVSRTSLSGTSLDKSIYGSLSGNGTWVLGQDQDSVGGGFDATQAFQGEIAELNIWDRVLSGAEINGLLKGCKSTLTGNVKAWKDFISGVKGNVTVLKPIYC